MKKENSALQLIAKALEQKNFAVISEEIKHKLESEINEMIKDGYINYNLFDCKFDDFYKDYSQELKMMSFIAKKAPDLLKIPDLREFLQYMYAETVSFNDAVKVMEAADCSKIFLATYAAENVCNPEVADWILTNWCYCKPYREKIVKAAKKHHLNRLAGFLTERSRAVQNLFVLAGGIAIGFILNALFNMWLMIC